LLLIPAVLLLQEQPSARERWRAEYALVWLAAFVSGPLAHAQLRLVPVAFQLSVPMLWIVGVRVYRSLMCGGMTDGRSPVFVNRKGDLHER